mgnify:CR=1 FL=1
MSCVRPGVREVRASFPCSVKVLMALDFPEFDLPANATSQPASSGAFSTALALCRNAAWRKFTGLGAALMSVIFAICAKTRNVYNARRSGDVLKAVR